jgi:hypothetical protein
MSAAWVYLSSPASSAKASDSSRPTPDAAAIQPGSKRAAPAFGSYV